MMRRSLHPDAEGQDDREVWYAMDRHKGLDELGRASVFASTSCVPGSVYLETARLRLDASFPGASKLLSFKLPERKEFE